MPDDFGWRMKTYEHATKYVLPPRTFTIIRVDGRAFHTYLRRARKPFDTNVIAAMDTAAVALCKDLTGAAFAYTQSDEISILLTDLGPKSQPWFGGVVQKMASLAASITTAAFNDVYDRVVPSAPGSLAVPSNCATFDARVYTIPSRIEVANYFLWRQQDAIRNAVSMAAQAHISHKDLHGVNTAQMQEMLFQEHMINFKTEYSDRERRGGVVVRKKTPTSLSGMLVGSTFLGPTFRHQWTAQGAPDFTLDNGGFLAVQIPQEPSDALQPPRSGAFWDDLREDMKDPGFAEHYRRISREIGLTDLDHCPHEAWEETPGGIPHRCNDCHHLFTTDEANARKGRTA